MFKKGFLTGKKISTAVLLSASLLASIPAQALDKDSFFYLLDAQILGGYSAISDNGGTGSVDSRWAVSPNVELVPDKLVWINLYEGLLNRSSQVVSQEEGGERVETTMGHSITTAFKWNITKSWAVRPLFFAAWAFVNETKDEDFGDGLYDYQDVGGGLESTWTTVDTKTRKEELRAGFRFFDREYPNFVSLLSLFDPRAQVQEPREKDFQGYKGTLGYEKRDRDSWSWGLEGIFLYKDYDDKRVIDGNGIRQADDYREDFQEFINVYLAHPIDKEWSWRLDGQVANNTSNLDFYDTHNTATLTDDDFIGEYYDYISFLVRPSIIFEQDWTKEKKFQASVSYTFQALYYLGRNAQNEVGRYGDDHQSDYAHTFAGQVSMPLTRYVSWVTVASYTIAESNQDFEAFYLYSYDAWTVLTGFSFKY